MTAGTLRDAALWKVIQRAIDEAGPVQSKWMYPADSVLVALREHLSAHPEAIEELGFQGTSHSWCWESTEPFHFLPTFAPAPPVPTHPGEPK